MNLKLQRFNYFLLWFPGTFTIANQKFVKNSYVDCHINDENWFMLRNKYWFMIDKLFIHLFPVTYALHEYDVVFICSISQRDKFISRQIKTKIHHRLVKYFLSKRSEMSRRNAYIKCHSCCSAYKNKRLKKRNTLHEYKHIPNKHQSAIQRKIFLACIIGTLIFSEPLNFLFSWQGFIYSIFVDLEEILLMPNHWIFKAFITSACEAWTTFQQTIKRISRQSFRNQLESIKFPHKTVNWLMCK